MVKVKDLLSALTLLIALTGYLPLQPYLDPSARWFFPVSLLLGLLLQGRKRVLPERVLTPLSILLFVYFAIGFSTERLITVTGDLLVVFLGIRMLGERSGRNYLQLFALSLFCLAASSLYNLSALFLAYLLFLLLLLAVSLVILAFHAHDPELVLGKRELKKVLGVSGMMPVASIPILLFLFFALPRTPLPFWDFLNRSPSRGTGFSERVQPGGAPAVEEVKGVVLRALSAKVSEERLYWRGIVLNGFSGDGWVRLPDQPEEDAVGAGTRIRQEIYPEPSQSLYLLALNQPAGISGVRQDRAPDGVFKLRRPLEKRGKYQAESILSDAVEVKGKIDRGFYLRLPKTVSSRVAAKGRELAAAGSAAQKLRLLERFFRDQKISYANTGLPVGGDPIDSFLFDKKRGNCEFFASSAATLLRLAGVPARLVGGYRGGTYNEIGKYYLVTEDMAHVWVEAYIDGRGWLTVDPSAWSSGFASRGQAGRKLRMYLDALGFYWDKAVITYDLDKQMSLFTSAGSKARNFRFPDRLWRPIILLGAALLPLAAVLLLYLRRPKSAEERILKRFLRVVARRYASHYTERSGLFELAERIDDPRVTEFAELYGKALYRDRRLQAGELARLREVIRLLDQHPS